MVAFNQVVDNNIQSAVERARFGYPDWRELRSRATNLAQQLVFPGGDFSEVPMTDDERAYAKAVLIETGHDTVAAYL